MEWLFKRVLLTSKFPTFRDLSSYILKITWQSFWKVIGGIYQVIFFHPIKEYG